MCSAINLCIRTSRLSCPVRGLTEPPFFESLVLRVVGGAGAPKVEEADIGVVIAASLGAEIESRVPVFRSCASLRRNSSLLSKSS